MFPQALPKNNKTYQYSREKTKEGDLNYSVKIKPWV